MIASTEACLTMEISDSLFLLQNNQLYRSQRQENLKSKLGGIMIGVQNKTILFKIDIKFLNEKLTSAFLGSLIVIDSGKGLII